MKPRHLRGNNGQGMNWIRPVKRLAIYLRDGLACVYCGDSIEDGVVLTLDHVVCRAHGGSNHETNLVTSCLRCNSSRGKRSVKAFAKAVAAYLNHGVDAAAIVLHVHMARRQALDVKAAETLMTRRGGFTAALRSATR
jgi:hypothetical protein